MTFILMWNPEISSTTPAEWKYWMQHFPFITPNWSIWDHDRVDWWDDFYMVKVGSGRTGIVAKGKLASKPALGEDWSGKGREVYYCDLKIMNIIDPENGPMITTAELEKSIPGFGWDHGHSGRLMSEEDAAKLKKLWNRFRKKNSALFDEQDKFGEYIIEPSALAKVGNGKLWYSLHEWCKDRDALYTDAVTHDCVNLSFSADYDEHEFKLKVYFDDDAVLDIKCSGIQRLKIDNDNYSTWDSDFFLAEYGPDLLYLRSNGVEVWCSDIRFHRAKPHTGDCLPVNL